ncbi:MAG TPA: tRNA epoxyqueuosine(34) reductase QueG [Saprospiraceae bacterium]|nr:tRNA epoxyqueuosine(34) reductase QueG [Saprospiraceae bacterium]
MPNEQRHTHLIRSEAQRLGFEFVGFARAERLDDAARRLEQWLAQGAHGRMAYMANHFDMRVDPTLLVPGAKTVICLTFNYHNPEKQHDPEAPRISQYAYGEDYHDVIKDKLKSLLAYMREQIGDINGRCFVDSAPVLEREWAQRAGLGWNGRHTLTIHPRRGSYFFLAEIICDLPLVYDDPVRDHCGTCRRCIDACPTQAIAPEGYFLDASRCISYLTIELRDEIPAGFKDQLDNWAFGCDVCQEVCPWNRFARRHDEPAFEPHPELLEMTRRDWQEMTEAVFGRVFKKSAVKRVKYAGLMRNVGNL